MQETLVQSLGWEDPLDKETATHSTILAWEIAMDRGRPWDFPGKSTGVGCHGLLRYQAITTPILWEELDNIAFELWRS